MCFRRKKKKLEKEQQKKVEEQQTSKKTDAKKVKNVEPKAQLVKEPVKVEPKDMTRTYHVAKREDGKWQVKFAGGKKAIKTFDTQKEAIAYTKTMASNQEGAMLVHNSKGANKGKIKKK